MALPYFILRLALISSFTSHLVGVLAKPSGDAGKVITRTDGVADGPAESVDYISQQTCPRIIGLSQLTAQDPSHGIEVHIRAGTSGVTSTVFAWVHEDEFASCETWRQNGTAADTYKYVNYHQLRKTHYGVDPAFDYNNSYSVMNTSPGHLLCALLRVRAASTRKPARCWRTEYVNSTTEPPTATTGTESPSQTSSPQQETVETSAALTSRPSTTSKGVSAQPISVPTTSGQLGVSPSSSVRRASMSAYLTGFLLLPVVVLTF